MSRIAILHLYKAEIVIIDPLPRQSGLVPYGDYVVGWTEGPLYSESEFYDLVEQVRRHTSLSFDVEPMDHLYIAC